MDSRDLISCIFIKKLLLTHICVQRNKFELKTTKYF